MRKKLKLRIPDTPALFMILICVVALLTLIIPSGTFDRVVDAETGRTLVVGGSYHFIEASHITLQQIFSSIFRGLSGGGDVAAFIFVCGGSFGILSSTGAIKAGLNALVHKFRNREGLLITIILAAFSFCGGTFGMGESALPFVVIIVAITVGLGMGPVTGLAIVLAGIYAGYSAGPINPFNTGIAQQIAELPAFSGIGLRIVLMIGAIAIAAQHTIAWGRKYRKNHPVPEELTIQATEESSQIDTKQKIILVVFVVSLASILLGGFIFTWGFPAMSAVFMGMGVLSGLIYYGNLEDTGSAFVRGACDMTTAVIYYAFARAVLVIMEDGQIMDTIVYALSIPLSQVHGIVAAWGIFISQGVINFFIPSSSGQAAAVMPILTPLADLIGVTRQTCILAYQCGDGFLNLITPTHAIVCAACGLAGVKFTDWFKYSWRLVVKWCLWTLVILTIATVTSYGPF